MSARDDGGPAFPLVTGIESLYDGMSLRDYFAAKAMQALVMNRCYPWDSQMPAMAFEIADAMVKERAK